MGHPPKRRVSGEEAPRTSRRTTQSGSASGSGTGTGSKRYTPPESQARQWIPARAVPVVVFGLLGLGLLLILANYVGAVPGGNDNRYLILGLTMILGGIIAATQWR